jgi:hypothetical protein
MHARIGSALLGLALALSITAVALAQAEDDTVTSDDTPAAVDVSAETVAPALFLQLTDPTEEDLEVPLDTANLTITGATLPGAVVSVDGDLADVDDQGNFTDSVVLDEGANEIDVVASDAQGNQVSTAVYVVRGE